MREEPLCTAEWQRAREREREREALFRYCLCWWSSVVLAADEFSMPLAKTDWCTFGAVLLLLSNDNAIITSRNAIGNCNFDNGHPLWPLLLPRFRGICHVSLGWTPARTASRLTANLGCFVNLYTYINIAILLSREICMFGFCQYIYSAWPAARGFHWPVRKLSVSVRETY